ncbi:recombinase family protein [Mycolicibacterium sp.]|uniref:recombinase family protein n=1 Tax=Mycolicibacterium sp. TaxID=2320850 RepID=UPI0037CAFB5D
MAVAIYTRISHDKTGNQAGVERQAKECRELAAARGLSVTIEHSDNDISAFSGRRRPGFENLLRDVQNGIVDTIIVWHPDRLYRRSADLELLINLVEKNRVKILSVTAGDFDLNTASGRAVARTLVAWSGFEVEQKADRQRSAYRQRAESGAWPFTHRPFGYERTKQGIVQVPEEAAVLRDILTRYYEGGEPRHAIMRDLNARGILTPQGKPWGIIQLRDVLMNDRYGGLVKHGETVLDAPPLWEPIIDRDVWLGWRSAAAARKRRSTFSAARYLLTGIARCGVCDAKLYVKHRSSGLGRAYACSASSCVYRSVTAVDALVSEVLIRRLSLPDAVSVFADREMPLEWIREATALQDRLDSLAVLVADGTLNVDGVREAAKPLRKQLQSVQERIVAHAARAAVPAELLAGDVRAQWEALPLTTKRAVIGATMAVTVHRQEHPRPFDPESIEIRWLPVTGLSDDT